MPRPSPKAALLAHHAHKPYPSCGRARTAQVNIAGRDAALSPGASDTLAAFAGTYATHQLPAAEGGQAVLGAEVVVTVNSQGAAPLTSGHRKVFPVTG